MGSLTWCIYKERQFHRDVHVMTQKLLFPLFCMITSYLWHIDCLVVILKFYTVLMFLLTIRNFVNKKVFSSKQVSIFFNCENMTSFRTYVTAKLRAFLRDAAHYYFFSSLMILVGNVIFFLPALSECLPV